MLVAEYLTNDSLCQSYTKSSVHFDDDLLNVITITNNTNLSSRYCVSHIPDVTSVTNIDVTNHVIPIQIIKTLVRLHTDRVGMQIRVPTSV